MLNVTDSAYRFGAGRYFQQSGLLAQAGELVPQYGKKPFIIGGPNALLASRGLVESLRTSGISAYVHSYAGQCCQEALEEAMSLVQRERCDVIVGCGGGRIMDLAKSIADRLSLPIINVPTSAATCAAFTPFSRLYTKEGATINGNDYHLREVDMILVDMDIMACQPPRLLIAGMLDAMAKAIEITDGKKTLKQSSASPGLYSAYLAAGYAFDALKSGAKEALDALLHKEPNEALHNVVFINIALTGVVSGLSRGTGQTAIGHDFYYLCREAFTKETLSMLHGELVAVGCLAQLQYNGDEVGLHAWQEFLSACHAPTSLGEIGISPTAETMNLLWERLSASSHVLATDEGKQRFRSALERIR